MRCFHFLLQFTGDVVDSEATEVTLSMALQRLWTWTASIGLLNVSLRLGSHSSLELPSVRISDCQRKQTLWNVYKRKKVKVSVYEGDEQGISTPGA